MHDKEERDDFGSTRYGLKAWWYSTLANGDSYRHEVYFPLPGTVVRTNTFQSPKRWRVGLFYLKQAFTMTQDEMLARVVEHVRDIIDFELARQAMMQKVFEDAWQGPKEVPKEEDNSAQMAAGLFVGGSLLLMDDPPE